MNRELANEDRGATEAKELPELAGLGVSFVNSPHPMWIYDMATLAFLEVNDAAVRAYGYSRQEFMNMTLLDIRPAQDVRPFLQSWEHPHEVAGESWRHISKDGKVFPVSITSWEFHFRGRRAELVQALRKSSQSAMESPGG